MSTLLPSATKASHSTQLLESIIFYILKNPQGWNGTASSNPVCREQGGFVPVALSSNECLWIVSCYVWSTWATVTLFTYEQSSRIFFHINQEVEWITGERKTWPLYKALWNAFSVLLSIRECTSNQPTMACMSSQELLKGWESLNKLLSTNTSEIISHNPILLQKMWIHSTISDSIGVTSEGVPSFILELI